MKKRLLAICMAALMSVSLLAGCTNDSSSSTGNSAGQSTGGNNSSSAESKGGSDASVDGTWLPEGEKPTLRQLGINQAEDYNTYPVAADIEEVTGYHVEYDMLPSEGAMDKLNLIMASNEDYDMVVIGGETARVMEYALQGALMDISPYLQYTPNLDAAINDYERETFTVDGSLYAIGMSQLAFDGKGDIRQGLWMRQDWLDELNLQSPTTTEELKEVLRAFKGYDNGTGTKTIPMTLRADNVTVDGLVGAFGLPNPWNEVDGELVYRGIDPRIKDYLSYMKELYQEGLLDAELPANQPANVTEKYTTGMAGTAMFGFWDAPSVFTTMEQSQPNQKTTYVVPLEGPNGDRSIGTVSGGFDRIAFVPAVCQNIEHVMNFMNIKLEEETFVKLTIGEEGTHYTVDEEGERWPTLPTFFDERGQANNYSTGRYADLYSDLWKTRNRKDARQYEVWEIMNGEGFIEYRIDSEVNKAPAFPETSKNKQTLDQMLLDQHIKIIAGNETVEDYDAFVEQWLAAGGQAMIDEHNQWYAEFNK